MRGVRGFRYSNSHFTLNSLLSVNKLFNLLLIITIYYCKNVFVAQLLANE